MAEFSADDHRYMARALTLARRAMTTAHPNPRVGCVLAAGGEIVGEGWHERAGEAHAEVNAIAAARGRARGATAYVSLQPCAHQGRTGPCTAALIEAGIGRVVYAVDDPSPHTAEQGRRLLEAAGIEVADGLLAAEATRLNEGFLSRIRRGRPFVRIKIAAGMDGGTAMESGQSRWITGDAARRDVQRLRAECGAILTGVGTVLADDPSLTVRRDPPVERQPLRAIVDSRLRTPPAARMLALPGETIIFCTGDSNRSQLEAAGAAVQQVEAEAGRVALVPVLRHLGSLGVNDLLVEAGPVLSGGLLAAGLVDELVIYQAPHIMGSETRGMFVTTGWTSLENRVRFEILDLRRVGSDLRIVARPMTDTG
jgi:diaminohydroxyphosphoribosylaminopyrimidine deaminase / 5-amino-6-(5-phosphoribosylamino)uracil reductase